MTMSLFSDLFAAWRRRLGRGTRGQVADDLAAERAYRLTAALAERQAAQDARRRRWGAYRATYPMTRTMTGSPPPANGLSDLAPGSTAGRVPSVADDDTSIKVSRQTRDRLARLAAERRTTLKDLVDELAAATLTDAELAERELRARSVLAEHFGIEVTDSELAASARLRDIVAGRDNAA